MSQHQPGELFQEVEYNSLKSLRLGVRFEHEEIDS